ncbi:protein of unknown function [Burkholderia multivorans]
MLSTGIRPLPVMSLSPIFYNGTFGPKFRNAFTYAGSDFGSCAFSAGGTGIDRLQRPCAPIIRIQDHPD